MKWTERTRAWVEAIDANLAERTGRTAAQWAQLAREHGVKSIAFPAISTGVYHFPKGPAAQIALRESREHAEAAGVELVEFVCFDEPTAVLTAVSNPMVKSVPAMSLSMVPGRPIQGISNSVLSLWAPRKEPSPPMTTRPLMPSFFRLP